MLTRSLLCLCILLSASTAWADDATPQTAPKTFHNVYKARIYGFSISVIHALEEHEQGQKMLFMVDSAFMKITETSIFDWPEPDSLRPLAYSYERTGLGRNRSAKLGFNWDTNKVTNNVQNKPWYMSIAPGIKDKLNFQVQLQHDLIAGKKDLAYGIADGGKMKHYIFTLEGSERLSTPLGDIDTIKVKRSRKDSERVTYAWMAPEYAYLLVRMQQEKGSSVYTIDIHEAQIDGETITHF